MKTKKETCHKELAQHWVTQYHLTRLLILPTGGATVTPGFKGRIRARIKCVIGSSFTHIMTHGTETNVTSLHIMEFCIK
jgi:hypothetical protein